MNNPFKVLLEESSKSSTSTVPVVILDRSGRYRIGAPTRPNIVHDNGFLDKFPTESPTASDRAKYAAWYAKGVAAKALCNPVTGPKFSACNYQDQTDAAEAYLHYMSGSGEDREIDYSKFITKDSSGIRLLESIINDAKEHIGNIGINRSRFSVTSEPYLVGGVDSKFPTPETRNLYPATTNWQRAIGGHPVWVSGDVEVSVETAELECKLVFIAKLTLHMEDMYNFNPGMKDINSNIPDSENGRFQIVGLAKQYLNIGTYEVELRW